MTRTKYTIEMVKKEFEKRGFILLEMKYIKTTHKMKFICPNGHEGEISLHNLQHGTGCKKCAFEKMSKERSKPIEEVIKIFEDNNCVLLTLEYKNMQQKLKYICECGNISEITLSHFLLGHRCEECAYNKRFKYNLEKVQDIFKENNCILLEDKYINSKTPMEYICNCGRKSKITLSNFLKGVRCRQCSVDNHRRENHPNWNPNLTDEEREIGRFIDGYCEWRQEVLKKDNYTCQHCFKRGGKLNTHHLDGYDWCVEKRTDIDNGVTLCKECHIDFHNEYGRGDNTKEQFEEWIKKINLI